MFDNKIDVKYLEIFNISVKILRGSNFRAKIQLLKQLSVLYHILSTNFITILWFYRFKSFNLFLNINSNIRMI